MAKLDSVYQGKPCSSDGVKKTVDFQGIKIHLDRPKGLVMSGEDKEGKPWKREYKYDYGFIPKTLGGDGDGLDVFIGPDKDASETYWAIQKKDDGSFDEFKAFVGFSSRDAALAAFREHIPMKYLDGMVTLRINMMKAMLGIHPGETKTASALSCASVVSFLHHVERLSGC